MQYTHWLWWIASGVLLAAELATGTFYLLMIAAGAAAAGLAQALGLALAAQLVIGACVALVAIVILRRSRFGKRAGRNANRNPDVNLDIGAVLQIDTWQAGHARVQYRGAPWDVDLAPGESESAQWYQVSEVQGSRLIVVARPAGR
jgi:membrane protein implicated in regulation of membrane protease activity